MRIIGKRQIRSIAEKASGALLKQGAVFNDEIHRLPTGAVTYFPKGIYRYKTNEEANAHWDLCMIEGMARNANN
ncbi:hypothetical protein JYT26_01895 [Beggiatoa alba]|nr:hypothetical protein [Beggiatoa alba]